MRIREMEMDRDLADYARLRAIADDWNLTPEQILERLAKSGDRLTTRAFVAEVDGRVVGFSRWARFSHEKPGIAQVMLAVEPDHERAGIGTALFERVEENLNEHKLDKPWGFAREDRARGIRFAQVNGYREKRRYFDSVADLTAFDPANATIARSHLESLGLTICRFEIASGQHPELPALYDLYAEADADGAFHPGGRRALIRTLCLVLRDIRESARSRVRRRRGRCIRRDEQHLDQQ